MKMMTSRWEGDDNTEVGTEGHTTSTSRPRSRKGSIDSGSSDYDYLRDATGETPLAGTRDAGNENEKHDVKGSPDGSEGSGSGHRPTAAWECRGRLNLAQRAIGGTILECTALHLLSIAL